jgi:hypothetical protein
MILEAKLPGTFARPSCPKAASPAYLAGGLIGKTRLSGTDAPGRHRMTREALGRRSPGAPADSIDDGGAALPAGNQPKQHTATE